MLAHTKANERALNESARATLREHGELGLDIAVETSRGERQFATGDRLLFLRNERNMGVKNGTLGTVAAMENGSLIVATDDGRIVPVDPRSYQDIDHGFATTVHKSQGVTVDESYVLASRGFDKHLSYVSFSRHRKRLNIVYSQESFGSEAHLLGTLARDRSKDTSLDYREVELPSSPAEAAPSRSSFDERLEDARRRGLAHRRDRGLEL